MCENLDIFESIEKNDFQTFRKLIDNGIDVNIRDIFGNTPLHLAVMRNNALMMWYLIKHKAGINTKNNFGETPISLAVDYDSDLMLYVEENFL